MLEWLLNADDSPVWFEILTTTVVIGVLLSWKSFQIERLKAAWRRDNGIVIYMAMRDFELYNRAHEHVYGEPAARNSDPHWPELCDECDEETDRTVVSEGKHLCLSCAKGKVDGPAR